MAFVHGNPKSSDIIYLHTYVHALYLSILSYIYAAGGYFKGCNLQPIPDELGALYRGEYHHDERKPKWKKKKINHSIFRALPVHCVVLNPVAGSGDRNLADNWVPNRTGRGNTPTVVYRY